MYSNLYLSNFTIFQKNIYFSNWQFKKYIIYPNDYSNNLHFLDFFLKIDFVIPDLSHQLSRHKWHLRQKRQKMAVKKPRITPEPSSEPPCHRVSLTVFQAPSAVFQLPVKSQFACLQPCEQMWILCHNATLSHLVTSLLCNHPCSAWVFVDPTEPTVMLPWPSSNLKPHPQTFEHTDRVEVGSFLRKIQS